MASGVTLAQGRAGYAAFAPQNAPTWQPGSSSSLGTLVLFPVYSWNLQAPRNRVTGDPLGNVAPTNFRDGLITARLTTSMMVSKSAGSVLELGAGSSSDLGYMGLLPYFIQRYLITNSGMDDTVPFTIQLSDGNSLWSIPYCKPESFSLRIQKGRPIGFDCVWVAPLNAANLSTIRTDARATSLSGSAGSLTAIYQRGYNQNFQLLMYQDAIFGIGTPGNPASAFNSYYSGGQYNGFYSMDINFSNNHITNAPLDGTDTVYSFDAGMMRGGADFTIRAYSGTTGDAQPILDSSPIQIQLALANGNLVINMPQVVTNTDLDGGGTPGASMRLWRTMLEASFTSPVTGGSGTEPQGGSAFYQPIALSMGGYTAGIN
jgi:hypothetical protein